MKNFHQENPDRLDVPVDKLSPKKLKALELWDGWFYRFTQTFCLHSVNWLLQNWCGLSFQGNHHLDNIKQCIFAPTHYSHLDFWATLAAVPSQLRENTYVAAAKDHFYAHPFRYITTKLGSYHNFPFERQNLIPSAYQQIIRMIQTGCSLLIFPQGTRSRDGAIKPFKSLVALLAVETQVPVVPVFIQGTFEALPAGKLFIRKHPITVIYGKPINPPIPKNMQDRKQLLKQARAFNQILMDAIESLLNSKEK